MSCSYTSILIGRPKLSQFFYKIPLEDRQQIAAKSCFCTYSFVFNFALFKHCYSIKNSDLTGVELGIDGKHAEYHCHDPQQNLVKAETQ